jgi:hypothetical protein
LMPGDNEKRIFQSIFTAAQQEGHEERP